jgi:cell division protein FtsI (penicillin-binding protein 3)
MATKNSIDNKKIQRNYFIVALLLSLIIIAILGRAFVTSFVEGKYWIKIGERYKEYRDSIPATRGNIYSSEDELMAVSETYYQLYMDFWAQGINDSILKANVKPLSIELSKMFPEKSAFHYETDILNGLRMRQKEAERIKNKETKVAKKSTEYKLAIREVDYFEYKKIKALPFFKLGRNKSGLYDKEFIKRIKPFGTLASRAIGDIWDRDVLDTVKKQKITKGSGKFGLELAYDSILQGKPGFGTRKWVEGRMKTVPETEPVQGKNIVSTIDITIQDITERALSEKLKELDAESGTAVVMEVQTGEIKAITNRGQTRNGEWEERVNYAISDMSEPGSTFKVASMMVALEDGIVQPNDPIDVGNGRFEYAGSPLIDHNASRGGYGKITVAKTIWFSSNIGVAKIILKGYEKDAAKYVEGLYRIGFNKDLNLEIPGYGKAKIRHPKESPKTWSKTTLPWMSFGYETQIPPIYTLTFFNAIANKNGEMIKPLFVKEIKDAKKSEKKRRETINKSICSEQTLRFIREMLDSVVNHPQGTGKPVHSEIVRIAGKTGTAQLSQGAAGYKAGGKSHQVSFCGYFPADTPKYSCIVVIRRPRNGNASGGFMSGAVFKRIAEEVYLHDISAKPVSLPKKDPAANKPKVKNGLSDYPKFVMNKLNIRYTDSLKGEWMTAQWIDDRLVLKERPVSNRAIPNVVGMGAKDAVYALENAGLQVNLQGRGEVYSQSLHAGATAARGQTITIQLR